MDWSFNMADNQQQTRTRAPRPQMAEEKQFDERVVYVNRVARVVKGGRRFRFQALVVVGDHKGQVGIGVSKGADVAAAVSKATEVAKKHLVKIPMHGTTLTHEVEGKIGGAKILIMPAAPGTGLIAGGVVRIVLEVAGIENALSKSLGSSNRVNTAYATLDALSKMEPAHKWIPRQMAKKTTAKPKAKAEAK
jgi:small subunit ribosomal protein S5